MEIRDAIYVNGKPQIPQVLADMKSIVFICEHRRNPRFNLACLLAIDLLNYLFRIGLCFIFLVAGLGF
jgi:hypothetical protein